MTKDYKNRNEGQVIFKNIFEYLKKGWLNNDEFCELMLLIYSLRWDIENYNPNITCKNVQMIWNAIEPTIKKSKLNAEYYNKNNNKKEIKPNSNFETTEKETETTPKLEIEETETFEEIDEEKGQLFLNLLQEKQPQKNQSLYMLIIMNPSIRNFCDTNEINKATQEKAWDKYIKEAI